MTEWLEATIDRICALRRRAVCCANSACCSRSPSSEPALAALSDADVLHLRAEGLLAPIYTHPVSLRAIERLPQ